MTKYVKQAKEENGIFKEYYKEDLCEEGDNIKFKERAVIDKEVFDIHDSVADNAKWAAILTTAISIIYNSLDEETKKRMDPRQRGLMDLLVSSYASTTTRFEVQYEKEGIDLIFKMISRQHKIGSIIKDIEAKKK